jgi:TM2 domain-containing membrane protein YozV
MSKILKYLPEIEGDEQLYVATLMREMSQEQAEQFAQIYRTRRKDPTIVLLLGLVVFIGFGGLNRFYLGKIGTGIIYIFTLGLCFIGSIIDLLSHRDMTFRYNCDQADEVAMLVRGALPGRGTPELEG